MAHAVMLPSTSEFEQDVSDYIWMLKNKPPDDSADNQDGTAYNNDVTDWILTFSALAQGNGTLNETLAHSIARWKQTGSVQWLVAVIAGIPASGPNAPSLIKSAQTVKADSPAFATVTYHSARLLIGLGKTDEARKQLDVLLARRDELPISTVN